MFCMGIQNLNLFILHDPFILQNFVFIILLQSFVLLDSFYFGYFHIIFASNNLGKKIVYPRITTLITKMD